MPTIGFVWVKPSGPDKQNWKNGPDLLINKINKPEIVLSVYILGLLPDLGEAVVEGRAGEQLGLGKGAKVLGQLVVDPALHLPLIIKIIRCTKKSQMDG